MLTRSKKFWRFSPILVLILGSPLLLWASAFRPGSLPSVKKAWSWPWRYDFYLVLQSVRQGPVNPTSYTVIHNTSGLPADKIQKLRYKLCNHYYNWPGTVQVPAPVQFDHKLAYLVGTSIHQQPSNTLSKVLYCLLSQNQILDVLFFLQIFHSTTYHRLGYCKLCAVVCIKVIWSQLSEVQDIRLFDLDVNSFLIHREVFMLSVKATITIFFFHDCIVKFDHNLEKLQVANKARLY